jgi:hypothetical protein
MVLIGFAAKLMKQGFKAKAHFVEPLLIAIIQNRLADTVAVEIGILLLRCSPLKVIPFSLSLCRDFRLRFHILARRRESSSTKHTPAPAVL